MSNRLWAQHVKKKSFYRRLPRWARIIITVGIISSLIAGVYGAVQVILSIGGSVRVVGTGLIWTQVPTLMNQNITDPLTGYEQIKLNSTWGLQNTGAVPLSIKYVTRGLPANVTLQMYEQGGQEPTAFSPGQSATGGWFNLTIGHFDPAQAGAFTLTVYGCYPVGLC